MASSFEKSVKGATKVKLAAPKSKYVEHILVATHVGEAGVAEIFRALQNRLRDSTWTIVFKSLIVIHLMIREGEPDVTLKYLAHSPSRKLAINNFTEVQQQGRNIRAYSEYLLERAQSYGSTKVDYVRNGEGRLKRLTVDKGLLRETECVQSQIRALLKCEFLSHEPENEITLTAFRLLTMDLLVLFHVMNEGTINVLEHYFEMSKNDADRALNIYRTFVKQTDQVVQYLSVARLHEHSTRLEIPRIKHAPLSLATSLEEYLNDKDFDINRRQYLAQQDAKKRVKSVNGTSSSANEPKTTSKATSSTGKGLPSPKPSTETPARSEPPKGPAQDLIDLFDSIENNQQTMAQPVAAPFTPVQQVPQMQQSASGFQPVPASITVQQTAAGFMQPTAPGLPPPQQQPQQQQQQQQQQQPFSPPTTQPGTPFPLQQLPQQVQPSFTGVGFTGNFIPQQQQAFNPQSTSLTPIPQNGVASFAPQPSSAQFGNLPTTEPASQQQPQSTNPFRQSIMPTATGPPPVIVGSPSVTSSLSRSATNPFAKHTISQPPSVSSAGFGSIPSIQAPPATPFSSAQPTMPLQATPTGTNPFARHPSPGATRGTPSPLSSQGGLTIQPTGSTNPFRQSTFVNQQTGQGWQASPQATMGGLEQLPTIPIFPRPGQAAQQQAPQQQQSPQPGWS